MAAASKRRNRRGQEMFAMLQPKKTKFRKQFKGRISGTAKGGTAPSVQFTESN